MPSSVPKVTAKAARPRPLRGVLAWLHRYRHALAPLSFAAGAASCVLIHRQERLAQWLAALLFLSWLGMWLEGALARRLRLPPALLRFVIQAIHQETFFFALPFFFATTLWSTPQAGFTILVVAAALATLWDPFYFGTLASRRWMYLGFHAFAIFVTALVALPILVHLTTTQSLALASAAMGLFAVPSLAHVINRQRATHWVLLVLGSAALGGLAWLARPWVPPATLWVEQALITETVDAQSKSPGLRLFSVSAAHVHRQGLYAYTAIHAPRGLREQVFHRWVRNGREVDRIPLEIVGGRAEGYRAWSYKKGFPAEARGEWRVEVVTEGGQRIGEIRFRVV
ncbi:MAG: DUF2914 domain-containing protein [Nevskiales bacterium]|nr:DUF2914 domain-containing protein [Nevskiales bacterium]